MLLYWEVNLMHSYAREADNSYLWQTELMITCKESSVWVFSYSWKVAKENSSKTFWRFLSSAGEEII